MNMKRHPVDLAALLFGLAFVITAGGVLVYELSDTDVDPAWMVAMSLIVLGVVALATTLFRRPSSEHALAPTPVAATTDAPAGAATEVEEVSPNE
jgi:hypothetical protein